MDRQSGGPSIRTEVGSCGLWCERLAVSETEGAFTAGTPTILFEAPYAPDVNRLSHYANYDVSLDGQQFLMVRCNVDGETPAFTVVLHWFEELTRLVPTP